MRWRQGNTYDESMITVAEKEMRMRRRSFTGHRPEKLQRSEQAIKADLEYEIRMAIADGFTPFISGVARGTDIWAAEIVLQLRDEGYIIRLICASPYPVFEHSWSAKWQQAYCNVVEAADLVRFISPTYSWACFQVRNEWMVNHCARVIAVYNGQSGGTKNTIDYAARQSVLTRIVRG